MATTSFLLQTDRGNRMSKRFMSKYDGKKRDWLHAGVRMVLLLIVAFVVFQMVFGIATVSGESMEPTLQGGDVVVYLRMGRAYEVGDIVTISMPSGEFYIKRVVGLPGDTLELSDGTLLRNGTAEAPGHHVGPTHAQAEAISYPLTLDPQHYFTLGDNRPVSIDSRTFGSVFSGQIRGRVIWVLDLAK